MNEDSRDPRETLKRTISIAYCVLWLMRRHALWFMKAYMNLEMQQTKAKIGLQLHSVVD